jgi:D-glycerate 3-kinase
VLSKVTAGKTDFLIPRFNKATDDPYDESQWQHIEQPIDILILEGWCWGVTAQDETQLIEPINSLEEQHDEQSLWRTFVNQQLLSNYQSLYQYMNFWVALQVPSFDSVYKWRLEQEQKLIKTLTPAEQVNVMNEKQILSFIQYFQRLTTYGMHSLPLIANTVFYLDDNRSIIQCVEKD